MKQQLPALSINKHSVGLSFGPEFIIQFVRLIPGCPLFGHTHQFARVGSRIFKYWTVNVGRLEFGVIYV